MGGILYTVAVVLVVLWAIGFFFAHLGSLMHIALVIAIVLVVYNLVAGRRAV